MPSPSPFQLYTSAPTAWEAMLAACEQATATIDLEQFIFASDNIGRQFIDVCARKAQQGVKVRFLWDSAGSWSLLGTFTADELRRKGIELVFFNTLVPRPLDIPRYRFWFFRNHRRSLIIDGQIEPSKERGKGQKNTRVAFTGSVSMTDKVQDWRETHIRVTGDVVAEISRAFESLWNRALYNIDTSSGIAARLLPSERRPLATDGINYVTNHPKMRNRHLYRQLVTAIRNAKRRIYITTPYFAPTHKILRILRGAARRGLDVRIILPTSSDHPIVDLCGRSYFTNLMKIGIKIYQYSGAMIHSKTIVIDNNWATVGTMNLDTIGLLYNYEANIVTTRSDLVAELAEHFGADMIHSKAVDLVAWQNRSNLSKILQFLARLLREFL